MFNYNIYADYFRPYLNYLGLSSMCNDALMSVHMSLAVQKICDSTMFEMR